VAALDTLIGAQRSSTKYKALNLQTNITIEQQKVLERVFDIICGDEEPQSNTLITKNNQRVVQNPDCFVINLSFNMCIF
jgi:nucleosome binding factor SPN SPT16 subunit